MTNLDESTLQRQQSLQNPGDRRMSDVNLDRAMNIRILVAMDPNWKRTSKEHQYLLVKRRVLWQQTHKTS